MTYTEDEKKGLTAESVKEQAHEIAARFKLQKKLKTMSSKQLYATPMNWESIESLNIVEHSKLRDWISSQIEEYLGESDDELVKFVLDKIRSRSESKSIIQELEMILEDDAHRFVFGLWRGLHLAALGIDVSTLF